MKHIRASARIDPERAPAFFNLLANTPEVEEARILEANTTIDGVETLLFAINGDAAAFSAEAIDTPGVESVQVSEIDDRRAYALLVMRPLETPLFDAIHEAGHQGGFVLRTPVVYRDGAMHGRVVGDTGPLQDAIENVPDAIDVRIDEIGRFRGTRDDPATALSDRQHEALQVAQELGYYDQPRGATHEEIAEELGCAPQTASDHLQKAEAKLVDAALDGPGPTG
ncbi:helix-turn-helix domain-containing protein [Natronoarchaeum rubrum]|uniref:helix-turn-helix domain-containing protein n=1 Tax=Natronoarchaeum rubrum TaxID=755311 RepID=UPI0021124D51|nr:helix-turn-helix domain-containing protein [Natronoarchaeum rubrum]